MKVFIADDSKLFRERLVSMLSDFSGIEIIGQAENGITAVNSIKKLKPDLVILDIRMPKKSGLKVLQEIKEDKDSPVVIMVTNYPYSQYREKCMEIGSEFFFDKSNEYEQVIEVVKQLMQKFNTY
jgi:YesN/AraC family two-component response regulator